MARVGKANSGGGRTVAWSVERAVVWQWGFTFSECRMEEKRLRGDGDG